MSCVSACAATTQVITKDCLFAREITTTPEHWGTMPSDHLRQLVRHNDKFDEHCHVKDN